MLIKKYMNKIITGILVFLVALFLFSVKANAVTREEAQNAIVKVAKEMIDVAVNKYHIAKYGHSECLQTSPMHKDKDGKLSADCGNFCGGVYQIVFGKIKNPISSYQIHNEAYKSKGWGIKGSLKGFEVIKVNRS